MTGTDQEPTLALRLTRQLPASPEVVFEAYTDPEQQKIWFAILDTEPGVVEIEVDLRVGGQQTAVWGPDREHLFRETQTFLEIDRPHRLVTESVGWDPGGSTMTTRVEVTFEPVDGGTRMTVLQSGFPTEELRDFFASEVWVGAFDRIEAYLLQASPRRTG